MKPNGWPSRLLLLLAMHLLSSSAAFAQGDGARVYWHFLSGTNVVTFWPIQMSANYNPLDPSRVIVPQADFEAKIAMLGYTKLLPLFGRAGSASLILPVGSLQGEVAGIPIARQQTGRGFGDPMLQLDVNLCGAPAINSLKDMLRYEPKFTVDLLGNVAFPVGEYDGGAALNLGMNRWYGRVGAPMMLSLGPWIPGEKTTLEAVPAVWIFGENTDVKGKTLKNDPLFQLEGHLTRDFNDEGWGSVDVLWIKGAEPELAGVKGKKISNVTVGFTLGFQVTDNLGIGTSYSAAVNDNDPGKVSRDQFRLMFNYGWHPLLEGMHRLSKGHH